MKNLKLLALMSVVLVLGVGNLGFADLVDIGPVDLHGTGFGNETVILTTQITGQRMQIKHNPNLDELGCDKWDGSAVALDAGCQGTGNTGGDEKGPAHFPHNDTPLLSAQGITKASQIMIIFDPNQQGPAHGITMDNLVVTIWDDSTGNLVWNSGDLTGRPIVFPTTDPGQGKSGFGFKLDSTQAAALNLVLDSDDRIGLSSHLSGANGGPDDYFLATQPVPEPASLLLFGSGLLGLSGVVRRRLKK